MERGQHRFRRVPDSTVLKVSKEAAAVARPPARETVGRGGAPRPSAREQRWVGMPPADRACYYLKLRSVFPIKDYCKISG